MKLPAAVYRRPPGLVGVEVLSCPDPGADFPAHLHDTLTLWINDQGGEFLRHRGNTDILQPDSFGLINAGEVHANGYAGGRGRHLRSIYVDEGCVRGLLDPERDGAFFWSDGLHREPTVHRALHRLHQILLCSRSPLACAESMTETLYLLSRHFGNAADTGGLDAGRLCRLRDLLHECCGEQLHLDDLAAEAGCTPAHLIRLFRQGTGLSPHAYLIRVRVARARRLLGQGLPPGEAATDCGFADQAHLTRWFKMLTGVTPAVYQRSVAPCSRAADLLSKAHA